MEAESMVQQEIDLETTDLGHLTFSSLDTHTSATTDGNLLSSLTTEPITDDISTTSVLTILPQVVSNFQRGLTPIEQSHYAVHSIGGNSPLQTTPNTGYELTDLGVAASIDTSCKLVSDSSEILLRSGDSNEAIQCMQTQGDQQSQQSEHITLGTTTWGSENNSLTFTSADDHHITSNCNTQAGRHVENFTTEYISEDQQKLPEFKSAFDCSSHNTEGTYLSTAVKVVTGHLPQQLYQVRNPLMNQPQSGEQQQISNLVPHHQGFKSTVSQQIQQNMGTSVRSQNANVTVSSRHISQQNGCGGVTQQSLNSINSNRTFAIRLPITTPLGKGLHLQLVAKGPTPLLNNSNNQTSSNFNITTNNITNNNNFTHSINSSSLKPSHNYSIGETVLLVRDKATGKSYIVPASSTPVTSEKNNQTKPIHHPEHQTINIRNNNSPCATPIDVVGTSGDSVYGDLGISEPQPIIDVNEFLNIPPKIIQSEQNSGENGDFVSSSGKSNLILSTVEHSVNNVNITTGINELTVVENGSSNDAFSSASGSVAVGNIQNFDQSGKKIIIKKEGMSKISQNDKQQKRGSNCSQIKSLTHIDVPNITAVGTITGENEKHLKHSKTPNKNPKSITGVDLIKMMAIKRCDRKMQESNTKAGATENEGNKNDVQEANSNTANGSKGILQNKTMSLENVDNSSFRKLLETDKKITESSTKVISISGGEVEMDSSIMETEQRIASIVPESMKDFVRDVFEDEDALDKEYIQEIMDDTAPLPTEVVIDEDSSSALSPGEIARHALQNLADMGADELNGIDIKSKLLPAVTVLVDKSQVVNVDGQKKWKCNICPKMYTTKHNLVTHILGHCEIKPHCCVLCGKLFKQPSHLHTHMLMHKQVKAFVCKVCNKAFTQSSHLKRHSAIHMEKRPHICDICNHGFAYPSELNTHKLKHMNEAMLECEKCHQIFDTPRKLKQHQSLQHRDTDDLTCKECGKQFAYPSQLKDHMMKHNGTRPFMCAECGMEFMKEHHVKAHLFTHTGQKPFACQICSRSFNQKANLQRHMLIHEENKRYKCDKCDKEFSQPQVLKSHKLTHSAEKPFKCDQCGKGFSRQHNLNGHLALHQGNKKYVCFCGASFTLKGNLNRHRKSKHNLSPSMEDTSALLSPTHSTKELQPQQQRQQQQLNEKVEHQHLASEQLAAESAAKILNMMSAKRTGKSPPYSKETVTPEEQDQFSHSIIDYQSNSNIELIIQDVIQNDNSQSSIINCKDTDGGDFENLVSNEDETSPIPKKKRKSVPSKIISKDGNNIAICEDESSYNNDSSTGFMDCNINNNEPQRNEKGYIVKVGTTHTTPVKRKQLKPKCLPLSPGKNSCSSGSKLDFESHDSNNPVPVSVVSTGTSSASTSSTRRKQKAVAKADVQSPDELVDEAEQEWQGTNSNLEDSRSGFELLNESSPSHATSQKHLSFSTVGINTFNT